MQISLWWTYLIPLAKWFVSETDPLADKGLGYLSAEVGQLMPKWELAVQEDFDRKSLSGSTIPNHNKIPDSQWLKIFQSPDVPGYQLRVKDPSELGIDTVKQYSGYMDIEDDKHFFYWFFESRNNPKTDPLIIWLNGGPGCSSMTGLFFELGPSLLEKSRNGQPIPVYNEYSWNNNASVIFLDQPVNAGHSYSSNIVNNTAEAARDFRSFLLLFFNAFPEYSQNPLHIGGESYGGHFVPTFASELLAHNDPEINLQSVLVGNGIFDFEHQMPAVRDMACGKGGYPSVLSDDECDSLDKQIPICQVAVRQCYDTLDDFLCSFADVFCDVIYEPYQKTSLNPFDIRMKCEANSSCYIQDDWINEYMNLDWVKSAIGSEKDVFVACSSKIGDDFGRTGDRNKPAHGFVAELLAEGIPVLIYAGDKDYRGNWLGSLYWTNSLMWPGSFEYNNAKLVDWSVGGVVAGEIKSAQNLTFLRMYDAGHMAPHDQPKVSLAMLNAWLSGSASINS